MSQSSLADSPVSDFKEESIKAEHSPFKDQLQHFAYSATSPEPRRTSSRASTRLSMAKTRTSAPKPAANRIEKSTHQTRSSGVDGHAKLTSNGVKKRSTAKQRSANDPYYPTNKLVDSVRPGLILIFIGLNPGLMTAATGHAYAHPSNRFWHLLHTSGVTPEKHQASETRDLMDLYSIGNTNICARPSRDGSSLTKDELREGAGILEKKIREMKPEAVAVVGKQIWEALWLARTGKKLPKGDFKWGWQDEDAWLGRTVGVDGVTEWAGARTFVTTSTSGLSANLSPAEKLAIWKPLGEWFTRRREEYKEQS